MNRKTIAQIEDGRYGAATAEIKALLGLAERAAITLWRGASKPSFTIRGGRAWADENRA
jgi:hypothetical protein